MSTAFGVRSRPATGEWVDPVEFFSFGKKCNFDDWHARIGFRFLKIAAHRRGRKLSVLVFGENDERRVREAERRHFYAGARALYPPGRLPVPLRAPPSRDGRF